MEIKDRIRYHLESSTGLPLENVKDDTSLLSLGIMDSMSAMDVILFIEREFNIPIVDKDIHPDNFDSIASIAKFVQSRAGYQQK